jgi:hypothetical protein
MKHVSLTASALLLIASAFVGSCDKARAFPIHPFAPAPHNVIVTVLCKLGGPHCNPIHGPKTGDAKVPTTSGWQDPDCKSYGNCNVGGPGDWGDPSISRQAPSGTQAGHYGAVQGTHMGSLKRR